MAFTTVQMTSAGATTINTLPNAGQATMANCLPVAVASDQSAIPVTTLNSGAITNPTSVLTRPSNAISASVTATNANPCVFTWTGNPLVNGQTLILTGTVPTGGDFVSRNTYYVVAAATNTFQLAATLAGTSLSSTSTGSGLTATFTYVANTLIASSSGASPTVPQFAIASAGGIIMPRIRILTTAATGWGGAILSVNLWTTAPTYTSGDGQPRGLRGRQLDCKLPRDLDPARRRGGRRHHGRKPTV